MTAVGAREIRFVRLSLLSAGSAFVGAALLATVLFGVWNSNCSAGAQLQGAPVQSCPPNLAPWIVLVISLALIAGGLVGLAALRRFHRRQHSNRPSSG